MLRVALWRPQDTAQCCEFTDLAIDTMESLEKRVGETQTHRWDVMCHRLPRPSVFDVDDMCISTWYAERLECKT